MTPTCGDIMKTNLRTIGEDEPLALAASMMREEAIHHLLVVDASGRLQGILSHRDLVRATSEQLDRVGAVMSRDLLVVSPETAAAYAVERMLRGKYRALPVVDDGGRPLGIVTSTDFLDIAFRALMGIDVTARRVHA